MNPSTPGLPVHHHLPEFTQTHIHRVSELLCLWDFPGKNTGVGGHSQAAQWQRIHLTVQESQGTWGSVPVSGRSSGAENGNPLQYSCLANPKDRGAWQATLHAVTKYLTRLITSMKFLKETNY